MKVITLFSEKKVDQLALQQAGGVITFKGSTPVFQFSNNESLKRYEAIRKGK